MSADGEGDGSKPSTLNGDEAKKLAAAANKRPPPPPPPRPSRPSMSLNPRELAAAGLAPTHVSTDSAGSGDGESEVTAPSPASAGGSGSGTLGAVPPPPKPRSATSAAALLEKQMAALAAAAPASPKDAKEGPAAAVPRKASMKYASAVGVSPFAKKIEPSKPRKDDPQVRLAGTIAAYIEAPYNRLADALPPAISNDPLVSATIEGLALPTRTLVRKRVKYNALEPTKGKNVEYDCDAQDKPVEGESSSSGSDTLKEKKPALADMFANPDGSGSGAPAAGASTSPTAAGAGGAGATADDKANEAKAVDALVHPEILEKIEHSVAKAAVDADQAKTDVEDGLFWRYQPDYEYKTFAETNICKREPLPLWAVDRGTQLLVSVKSLKFHVGKIEPYFCTLALYDFKAGTRLSEDFHFDLNDKEVLTGALEVNKSCADPETLARHAIFSISDKHEGVYLVLKVERVLQGDPDEDADLYLKPKQRTDGESKALSKKVKTAAVYLSDYRQPFVFGLQQLFSESGELLTEGKNQYLERIYWQPESLSDALFIGACKEMVANPKKAAFKDVPKSFLEFRLDELSGQLPVNRVDASLLALKQPEGVPLDLPGEDKKDHPTVKEVEEFVDRCALQHIPHTHFVNLLYVYPEFVAFTKYRNIAVKVQVKSDDAKVNDVGLRTLLGKSATTSWTTQLLSQVNYHKNKPTLHDEFKVLLPLKMEAKLHLLFTFYQISIKGSSPGKRETIGYSCLPLYAKDRIVDDGLTDLPIAATLPDNYLQPFLDRKESKDLHFRSSGEVSFKVRVKVLSSVFTQDPSLNEFFRIMPFAERERPSVAGAAAPAAGGGGGGDANKQLLALAVDALPSAAPLNCVKWMPFILNYLLKGIAARPAARDHLWEALNHVVHRVSGYFKEINRCGLLVQYVNHKFANTPGAPALYEPLSQLLLKALQRRADKPADKKDPKELALDRSIIEYAWLWLELMFKSMLLEREEHGALNEKSAAEFVKNFEQSVDLFVNIIYRHRSAGLSALRHLVNNLALFFCDLFAVLPRDSVVAMIHTFLSEFREVRSDPVLIEFKATFFDILFDHEYFLDIHDVATQPLEVAPDDAGVMDTIRERYRLVGLFVDDWAKSLALKESVILEKVINTMRAVLTKHDYDAQHQPHKAAIAAMYLPLVPAMVDELEALRAMDAKNRRNALVCFLWVLKHAPRHLLRQWWTAQDDAEFVADFTALLDLVLETFKYKGVKERSQSSDFASILSPEAMASFMDGPAQSETVGSLKAGLEDLMMNVHKTGAGLAGSSGTSSVRRGTVGDGKMSIGRNSGITPVTIAAAGASVGSGGGRDGPVLPGMAGMAMGPGHGSTKNLMAAMKGGTIGPKAGAGGLRAQRALLAAGRGTGGGTWKRTAGSGTMTSTSKEFLLRLVKWEGLLNQNVSRVVVSALLDVMEDFRDRCVSPKQHREVASRMLSLLTSLLHHHQSASVLGSVYPIVHLFLKRYGDELFATHALHGQIRSLAGEFLRHCTFANARCRVAAVSLLFQLLTCNFRHDHNLTNLQVSLTVQLSKMVPHIKPQGEGYLKQAVSALKLWSQRHTAWLADKGQMPKFLSELEVLNKRLATILADSIEISRQNKLGADAQDPTTVESLLFQVADAFSHIPESRVEWLLRLAEHHQKPAFFKSTSLAEAGYCYLTIAHLLQLQLKERLALAAAAAPPLPTTGGSAAAADHKASAAAAGSTSIVDKENTKLERSVAEHFESACRMLDQSELYEHCTDVYKELLPLYEKKKDYKALSNSHIHIHSVYEKLIEADKKQTRMLGTYYRIGFYGKAFGPRLDGNEFIYKMPKITRLVEVTTEMKKLYTHQLKADVRILQDSSPVDPAKLDPAECVIQVTFVTPHFEADDRKARNSWIQQQTRLDCFKFSTPFTRAGKAITETVTDQYKRNTLLYVAEPYPAMRTAQRVVRRSETILTPIEAAAEDVDVRTERMNEMLDSPHISAKALTALLQGSVATQVHGGAKEICMAFLRRDPADPDDDEGDAPRSVAFAGDDDDASGGGDAKKTTTKKPPPLPPLPNKPAPAGGAAAGGVATSTTATDVKTGDDGKIKYTPAQKALLRAAMRRFLAACQRALDVNRKLSESDADKAFQANLDNHFDDMTQALNPLIAEPVKKRLANAKTKLKIAKAKMASPGKAGTVGGAGDKSPAHATTGVRFG